MQVDLLTVDLDLDREGQVAVERRIVEPVGEAVGAIGDGCDPGAHLALGIVQELLAGRAHHVAPVFLAQRRHAHDAQPVGGHLRAQVGEPLARHLAVQQDQRLHVLLQHTFPVEPDRRDSQPLLIDVGVTAIGEIGMMRRVDSPGDEIAFVEDRLGEHDVRQMRAATLISVVADEDVPRAQRLDRVAFEDMWQGADETAEMHRDVLGLAERLAVHVEEGGRAVAPLLDVGGVARPHEGFAHLFDDGGEGAADHLDGDRIDLDRVRNGMNFAHEASRIMLR